MAFPFLTVLANEVLFEVFNQGSLINTVSRDFTTAIANVGESVSIILPETPAMEDAGGVFSANDVSPAVVTVKLDKWRQTAPHAVDMKSLSLADRPVLAMYAKPIAEAIRGDMEAAILAELVKFTDNYTGSVDAQKALNGTVVPAGIGTVASANKSKFDAIKAPNGDRFIIAGPTLEQAYWETFALASQAGDVAVAEQISGFMGRKLGMTFISNAGAEDGARLGVGYHRNALALATRPMAVSQLASNTMVTVQYGGIGITLETWHDPASSKDFIRGQVLYGLKALTSRGFVIGKLAAD